MDTVDEDLPKWLRFYLDNGGKPEQITVSTDASITSPRNMYEQIRSCILEHKFPIEQMLSLITANTAKVLKLEQKGRLDEGKDADILVLRKDSLEIKDVICNGRHLFRSGKPVFKEKFLEKSNRSVRLKGEKA
jgi:beta-aspartyl-dipeptidase (metallo-type)